MLENFVSFRFIGETRGMASTAIAPDRLIFARWRVSKARAFASFVL